MRQQILVTAARLFARNGYDGTSTREIAGAVGLRQPSIFHYFPSKDAILAGIVELLLRPSVAAVGALSDREATPGVGFYAAVYLDARHLARFPEVARAVIRLPEYLDQTLADIHRMRAHLIDQFVREIETAQRAGVFIPGDPQLQARLTAGMIESLIDPRFKIAAPAIHARSVADQATRALLTDAAALPAVVDAAMAQVGRIDAAQEAAGEP